jgi:hypothetical protein
MTWLGLSVLSDRGRALLARGEVVHDFFAPGTGKSAARDSLPPEPVLAKTLVVTGLAEVVVGSDLGLSGDGPSTLPLSGLGSETFAWGVGTGVARMEVEEAERQLLRRPGAARFCANARLWSMGSPWGKGPALTRKIKKARNRTMALDVYMIGGINGGRDKGEKTSLNEPVNE